MAKSHLKASVGSNIVPLYPGKLDVPILLPVLEVQLGENLSAFFEVKVAFNKKEMDQNRRSNLFKKGEQSYLKN